MCVMGDVRDFKQSCLDRGHVDTTENPRAANTLCHASESPVEQAHDVTALRTL
jgi:hypothetical protein